MQTRFVALEAGDRCCYLAEGAMALLYPGSETGPIAVIDSGEWAPRITSKPTLTRPCRYEFDRSQQGDIRSEKDSSHRVQRP